MHSGALMICVSCHATGPQAFVRGVEFSMPTGKIEAAYHQLACSGECVVESLRLPQRDPFVRYSAWTPVPDALLEEMDGVGVGA